MPSKIYSTIPDGKICHKNDYILKKINSKISLSEKKFTFKMHIRKDVNSSALDSQMTPDANIFHIF